MLIYMISMKCWAMICKTFHIFLVVGVYHSEGINIVWPARPNGAITNTNTNTNILQSVDLKLGEGGGGKWIISDR